MIWGCIRVIVVDGLGQAHGRRRQAFLGVMKGRDERQILPKKDEQAAKEGAGMGTTVTHSRFSSLFS